MENKFEMVAKTFQGLEDVLRDELIELGAENVEIGNRMVSFEGDNEILYKANLCCRTALRVLKPIVKFTAENTDDLYDQVRDLDWGRFMDPDTTFSIDSTVSGEDFTHSRYVTYRVKDGIVDHFNDVCGKRPSIRVQGADLMLNVHVAGNRVTISFDSSGEPLYKRGYRVAQTDAPINEVLAAGIILKTGWRGDCDFADPMCGSGTFLIEAALIAANINPGIYRDSFAFEKWKDFDADLFEELYNDDSGEREFAYKIFGGDIDPEAVTVARKNIKSAKVEDMIELSCKPFEDWTENALEGVMATNPPYGERLRPADLSALYRTIGSTLKNYFQGWHAWIIGYRDEHFSDIGLKPSLKIPLYNGSLECSLREYVMFDGSYSQFRSEGGSVENAGAKKQQGPKKVRHISDDEWSKESKKFNASKGFKDDKKKSKPFTREKKIDYRRDDLEDNEPSRNERPRSDRSYNDRPRNDRPRNDQPYNDRPRSNDSGRPGPKFSRDSQGYRNSQNTQNSRFSRDSQSRSYGYPNPGPFSTYDPAKSKKPKISPDRAEIINPVHFRQRKKRPEEEGEE